MTKKTPMWSDWNITESAQQAVTQRRAEKNTRKLKYHFLFLNPNSNLSTNPNFNAFDLYHSLPWDYGPSQILPPQFEERKKTRYILHGWLNSSYISATTIPRLEWIYCHFKYNTVLQNIWLERIIDEYTGNYWRDLRICTYRVIALVNDIIEDHWTFRLIEKF
jgi:hypothetical protein